MLIYLGTTLAISLFIVLLFPGVHLPTETASERVRDWMSRSASQYTESTEEAADPWMETRHVQTKTLSEGKEEANPLRTYRLVSWDEEQISMPHWVDYVKIVLLLFLTILFVTVPFLPFVLLNARRKKALAAMEEYRTDPVNDAVCGIFRRVIAWFEVLNLSGGNTLYSEWEGLLEDMLPEYRVRFAEGERLFEEAAYSDHLLDESARGQLLRLLEETQRILSRKANWKQRLRLKYWDYLWINA